MVTSKAKETEPIRKGHRCPLSHSSHDEPFLGFAPKIEKSKNEYPPRLPPKRNPQKSKTHWTSPNLPAPGLRAPSDIFKGCQLFLGKGIAWRDAFGFSQQCLPEEGRMVLKLTKDDPSMQMNPCGIVGPLKLILPLLWPQGFLPRVPTRAFLWGLLVGGLLGWLHGSGDVSLTRRRAAMQSFLLESTPRI